MKSLLLSMLMLFSFSCKVLSQESAQNDSVACPKLEIDGPYNGLVPVGDKVNLSIIGIKKKYEKSHKINYLWTISNGLIVGDAMSRSVVIDTKGLLGQDVNVTATVEGLDKTCPSQVTFQLTITNQVTKTTETRLISKPVRN